VSSAKCRCYAQSGSSSFVRRSSSVTQQQLATAGELDHRPPVRHEVETEVAEVLILPFTL